MILNGAERRPEAFAERAATARPCGDQRVRGALRQADANASGTAQKALKSDLHESCPACAEHSGP